MSVGNKRPALLFLALSAILLLAFYPDNDPYYPKDYFRSPIDKPLLLSGTFGELRPNHFHGGIDIKAIIGTPVRSVADGYVSLIRVQGNSYGNFLQVTHPNGYTSCYAHLNDFSPELREYIRSHQRTTEKFEVELKPAPDQFPVLSGDLIGEVGNTGASQGPHLHFEMRETQSGNAVNPLLFGFDVNDSQPPRMHQLKAYWLSEKREELGANIFSLVRKSTGYGVKGDTLLFPSPQVGFALKVYDHMNNVSNWNGIYAMDLYQDDNLIYNFTFEKIGFEETRYLNAHLDYQEYLQDRAYFNRGFALPGNQLSIYRRQKNNGVVNLNPEKASKIKMVTRDIQGNTSTLEFWARQKGEPPVLPEKIYTYFMPYNEASIIDHPSFYLHFPDSTLYEDLYMEYILSVDLSDNIYSSVHHLHDASVPIHCYFDLSIRANRLPEELRDKAFIALCGPGNRVQNWGGTWDENGFMTARVRSLGDFCIMTDQVAPTIRPVTFKYDMRRLKSGSFRISDNYPVTGNAKGLEYRATIDGEWVLMEHDAKSRTITHRFSKDLPTGKHEFRLVVTDALGNEAIYSQEFIK